jgi:hypothetical protein
MDAEQFLDRVVAPGNFIAVAYKPPGRGMGHKFFRREDVGQAAGYIRWAGKKGIDVWHGMASYADAQAKINDRGQQEYTGERLQTNTQQIRAFWMDLDLKRNGDGKDPAKVYANIGAAVTWLKAFVATTNMPLPNIWVNSGYGLHLYWVTEDPMPVATWKPYAEALKAAVMATGGLADLVVIADSARILRPPQSANMKDPANPAPVAVLDKYTRADYPNGLIYQALHNADQPNIHCDYVSGQALSQALAQNRCP